MARLDQLTNHRLNPLQIVGARARSVCALIAYVIGAEMNFWTIKKNVHLISFWVISPCLNSLAPLILANFELFMLNFEKNMRF